MTKRCLIGALWWGGLASAALGSVQEASDFTALADDVYAAQAAPEIPYDVLVQRLWAHYQQPLDLNQASYDAMHSLGILTEAQLDAFFVHIAQHGPLVSVYELQAIPALDLATIRRLIPFVYVAESGHAPRGQQRCYALLRYERQFPTKKGYEHNEKTDATPYAGLPDKVSARLHLRHPRGFGLGLVTSKGAGEALAWDPATGRYGLPWRCYGLVRHQGPLQTLVVGDYAVGYGQGLVLNAGFCMNQSSDTIQVIRTNNQGIRPHTSLSEAAFRGVATTWQWSAVELTTYYAATALDGKVEETAEGLCVRTVRRGGRYRTENEIAQKGRVNEQVVGSTVVYKSPVRGAELGLNALYGHYSLPIRPDADRGNPLRFRGQQHANGSLFCRYLWRNLHFFGEGGLSLGGGTAALAGVVASLTRYADAAVLWRHYAQDFHGPYGKAFRQNSTANSNERGIYLGTRLRPWRRWQLDGYYDYFHYPWLAGEAADGYSWLSKISYQPSRTVLAYAQRKTVCKPTKKKKDTEVVMDTTNTYKLACKYALSPSISLQSAVLWNNHARDEDPTWGCAVVQDVGYKVWRRLQLKGRVAWFSAAEYENRLWCYEPDVQYVGFNFPALYDEGMRYCLLMCYKPTAILRLEAKYALTWYWHKDHMGSGHEAMQGNVKHELRVQAIMNF